LSHIINIGRLSINAYHKLRSSALLGSRAVGVDIPNNIAAPGLVQGAWEGRQHIRLLDVVVGSHCGGTITESRKPGPRRSGVGNHDGTSTEIFSLVGGPELMAEKKSLASPPSPTRGPARKSLRNFGGVSGALAQSLSP